MTAAGISDTDLQALIGRLTGSTTTTPPALKVDERCTVTELFVNQCAHCYPKSMLDDDYPTNQPAVDQDEESKYGPWFPAQYRGACGGCGDRFDEGDDIRSDGTGGWLATCCSRREPDQVDATALIAPATAPATVRKPHPCDDMFCAGTPATCGWTAVEHMARPTGGTSMTATVPAPTTPTGPPPSTVELMRGVLDELDRDRPRSRQTTLGPSELGTPCQRQIAMKLAGVPRQPEDKRPPWAPMQGTAMHTLMEEALRFHNAKLGRERWLVEEQLEVDPGMDGVAPIRGHGDAYDTDTDTVVDWKYVGVTTLRAVKRKTVPNAELVKPEYRTQGHLYGYGHARKGRPVKWVRLVFLARSHDYSESCEWTEAYDPAIAIKAIDRYYATHDLLNSLNPAANPALWAVIPAQPGKACDWCSYRRVGEPADGTGCPGNTQTKIDRQLSGLLG